MVHAWVRYESNLPAFRSQIPSPKPCPISILYENDLNIPGQEILQYDRSMTICQKNHVLLLLRVVSSLSSTTAHLQQFFSPRLFGFLKIIQLFTRPLPTGIPLPFSCESITASATWEKYQHRRTIAGHGPSPMC